jgi:hypothetical protein
VDHVSIVNSLVCCIWIWYINLLWVYDHSKEQE